MNPKADSVSRVLYVDADSHARRWLKGSLSRVGLEVHLAACPVEALRLSQRWEFSVIVVDQGSAKGRVDNFVRRMRPLHSAVTFVLATADGRQLHGSAGTVKGDIVATLRKPFDETELLKVIEPAVALRDSRLGNTEPRTALSYRLLLVEDCIADAFLCEEAITEADARHEVVIVHSLAAGLEALHTQSFDAILSDLTLPDARGLDAVRRHSTAAPEAALLVLSGIEDDELGAQAVQLGAQDYLVKGTIEPPALHRAIRFAVARKRAEQRLFQMAHYDQLTGLANRTTFRDRVSHALARARRNAGRFAILFVDLDDFKAVNDTHGHEAGDDFLRAVSHRFRACLRDSDTHH